MPQKNSQNYFWPIHALPEQFDQLVYKDFLGQRNDSPQWLAALGQEVDKRALTPRSGTWGMLDKGETLAKSLGIGDQPLNITPGSSRLNPQPKAGGYASAIPMGRIFIQTSKYDTPDEYTSGLLFHELAHAADEIKGLSGSGSHHEAMGENFAPKMTYSMQAQRALEAGGLPDKERILAAMPWLKKVKPLSTNLIANPWALLENKTDLSSLPLVGPQSTRAK